MSELKREMNTVLGYLPENTRFHIISFKENYTSHTGEGHWWIAPHHIGIARTSVESLSAHGSNERGLVGALSAAVRLHDVKVVHILCDGSQETDMHYW